MKVRINTRLNKSLVIDNCRLAVINRDICIISERHADVKRLFNAINSYDEESLMAPGTKVLHCMIHSSLSYVIVEEPLRDDRPERYPWIESID